jgi:hypothetical protein
MEPEVPPHRHRSTGVVRGVYVLLAKIKNEIDLFYGVIKD